MRLDVDTPRPVVEIAIGANTERFTADFTAQNTRWCAEEEHRVRDAIPFIDGEEEAVELMKPMIGKVLGSDAFDRIVKACGTSESGAADTIAQIWEKLATEAYRRRAGIFEAAMERYTDGI